ncbi:MAG TPA: NAD(P)H-quinone oxidoreductase subunit D4, partial [Cyanophyceae cyanobacterium]
KLDNKTAYYPKVLFPEKAPALFLAALILFLGIQPVWLLRWMEPTTTAMVAAIPTENHQTVAINYQPSTKP